MLALFQQLKARVARLLRRIERTDSSSPARDANTLLPAVAREPELEQSPAAEAAEAERERRQAIAELLGGYLVAKYKQSVEIGRAFERFASAMRGPLSRRQISSLGGRARARNAFRWTDGAFMSTGDAERLQDEMSAEEYEHHAAGGRARAATARRAGDGSFLPDVAESELAGGLGP